MLILVATGCDQTSTLTEPDPADVTAPDATTEGRYIVVLDDAAASKAVVEEMRDRTGVRTTHTYTTALNGFAAELSETAVAALRNDPRVRYIEPDHVITLAKPCWVTGTCEGDGGGGSGQTTPWGVTRVGGAADGTGTTAWVIDTGVDLDHPDLNVDAKRSATFITKGKDSKDADDGNGHGTHVAGTIAALDNDADVVGVAAGATIVAVKVLNSQGSGSYSEVIAGVDYVAANAQPGDVANMSLGGPTSQALDAAVKAAADKGVVFALAAGNEGADANNSSPARVNHANVYTVSAIGENDCLASFSNYGNPPVDFAAPGVGVLSTYKDGSTATLNGTSMASPHVAGLLLFGAPSNGGAACGDPDGEPDTIASF